MSVVVLGGSGRIGTQLCDVLESAGIEYLAPSREEFDVTPRDGFRDLLSTGSLAEPVDTVINTTAYHDTKGCEVDPMRAFLMNAYVPAWLAVMCNASGLRFVHFSTDYVFGKYPSYHPDGYTPNAAPAPVNVYGESKAAGETLVLSANDRALIVRVASLFGSPSDRGDFVKLVRQRVTDDAPMQVVDDVTMSPTYTRDVANVLIYQALSKPTLRGIIHMVNSGCPVTWYEFARQIATLHGAHTDFIASTTLAESGDPLPRPPSSALSTRWDLPSWLTSLDSYMRLLDKQK
jgi:dTDP-4-dehydrorhamnose reductase